MTVLRSSTPLKCFVRLALVAGLTMAALLLPFGLWLGLTLPGIDQLHNCKSGASARGAIEAPAQPDCTMIEVANLPSYLIQALLATEDRQFYHHIGIEPRAIARAILAALSAERLVQGGSTITEQLAKSLLPPGKSKVLRKMQEMMLALWIERRFTKDAILEFYLNRAYFGSGAYGIEAASERYFGKSARSVTPYEAATLVGVLNAPSRYNPLSNPALANRRARYVLKNMVESGYFTEEQARQAAARRDIGP